jgi:hypothetical protein
MSDITQQEVRDAILLCATEELCREALTEKTEEGLSFAYEVERDGEEVFVLREHLTFEERRQVEDRLRRKAQLDFLHAEALDRETDAMIARGELSGGAEGK